MEQSSCKHRPSEWPPAWQPGSIRPHMQEGDDVPNYLDGPTTLACFSRGSVVWSVVHTLLLEATGERWAPGWGQWLVAYSFRVKRTTFRQGCCPREAPHAALPHTLCAEVRSDLLCSIFNLISQSRESRLFAASHTFLFSALPFNSRHEERRAGTQQK